MCCKVPNNAFIFVSQNNNKSALKPNTMKTLKFKFIQTTALLFLGLGLCGIANANNGSDAIIETEKTIKQHITFPNIILPIERSEKVEVVFTTAESGKVNFVLVKTENQILKKEIEKQFSELTLTKIKSNVAYSVVFNIKKV